MLLFLAASGAPLRDYDDDDDDDDNGMLRPMSIPSNKTLVEHKYEACKPRASYPKPKSMKGKMMSLGGEDAYLEKHVFGRKEYGVYLDVGCGDGYNGCNSYYFNKVKNWRGNCLDPDPVKYDAQFSGEAKRADGLRLALNVEEDMRCFPYRSALDHSVPSFGHSCKESKTSFRHTYSGWVSLTLFLQEDKE